MGQGTKKTKGGASLSPSLLGPFQPFQNQNGKTNEGNAVLSLWNLYNT